MRRFDLNIAQFRPNRMRASDAAAVPTASPIAITVCAIAFVAIWTLYGSITKAGLSVHGDMAEAYVWGREFKLGYNQHPPFWAWIAGVWFLVFPTTNWSFYLLAVVNSAIGLVGCWRLIGLFARDWEQRAAFTLLLLTPFYTFLCYKYNANSIFLSVWPWTLYFLITSIETGRRSQALWFGLLLGAGLMSKYYAVTLDITCLAASAAHPRARDYYRSASPYISIGVCCLLVMPHAIWLLATDAPPVAYIEGRAGIGLLRAIGYCAVFFASVALLHIFVLLLVFADAYVAGGIRFVRQFFVSNRVLAILALAPVILTAFFGVVFELKISSNMAMGTFPLLPLLAMRAVCTLRPRHLFRRALWLVAVSTAAVLIASPAIAYFTFNIGDYPGATEPRQELAAFVTRLWHEQAKTQLRHVVGSDPYENAIGFYSADHPAVFTPLDRREALRSTRAALERDGLLAVCVRGDAACEDDVKPFLTPETRKFGTKLTHTFWGHSRAAVAFDIYLVPQRPISSPAKAG